MITSLDVDGNGIDRAEYVVGMLLKLELVTEEDVRPFFEEFKQLDKDGSGHLDKKDLELAAQDVRCAGLCTCTHTAHPSGTELEADVAILPLLASGGRRSSACRRAQRRFVRHVYGERA